MIPTRLFGPIILATMGTNNKEELNNGMEGASLAAV
jgi:hypothetical protein